MLAVPDTIPFQGHAVDSPCGSYTAVFNDSHVSIYERDPLVPTTSQNTEVLQLFPFDLPFDFAAFSKDGRLLAVIMPNNPQQAFDMILVFRVEHNHGLRKLAEFPCNRAKSLVFSPDSSTLAVALPSRHVLLYSVVFLGVERPMRTIDVAALWPEEAGTPYSAPKAFDIVQIAITEDSRYLVVGTLHAGIGFFDLQPVSTDYWTSCLDKQLRAPTVTCPIQSLVSFVLAPEEEEEEGNVLRRIFVASSRAVAEVHVVPAVANAQQLRENETANKSQQQDDDAPSQSEAAAATTTSTGTSATLVPGSYNAFRLTNAAPVDHHDEMPSVLSLVTFSHSLSESRGQHQHHHRNKHLNAQQQLDNSIQQLRRDNYALLAPIAGKLKVYDSNAVSATSLPLSPTDEQQRRFRQQREEREKRQQEVVDVRARGLTLPANKTFIKLAGHFYIHTEEVDRFGDVVAQASPLKLKYAATDKALTRMSALVQVPELTALPSVIDKKENSVLMFAAHKQGAEHGPKFVELIKLHMSRGGLQVITLQELPICFPCDSLALNTDGSLLCSAGHECARLWRLIRGTKVVTRNITAPAPAANNTPAQGRRRGQNHLQQQQQHQQQILPTSTSTLRNRVVGVQFVEEGYRTILVTTSNGTEVRISF